MTTVKEAWDMTCPKCGRDDKLDVTANVNVRLTHDGTDDLEAEDGSHVWGAESPCTCHTCGFSGKVSDFETDDKKTTMKVSYRERDTILAALRLWQRTGVENIGWELTEIADNGREGDDAALNALEIDELCERLNCG